ncbi:MAG: hypothetical protein ACK4UV_00160 [Ignavibacterium sp.]
MSKSAKPLIFYVLFLLVIVTVFFIAVVIVKISYEETIRSKEEAERRLKTENQKLVSLQAEYQNVSAEDKIRYIASTQLGMIKRIETAIVIKVSKDYIKELEQDIKLKYE